MKAPKEFKIPILMYHQVSEEVHPNFYAHTVTTQRFKSHMKLIKLLGFKPITLDQLYGYYGGRNSLPSKSVIITFDDVMEDAIENAVPILEEIGFNAVFYVPTEYVGRKSSWMLEDVNVEFQVADWPSIKELDVKGFEIGSHTLTHPDLTKISLEQCSKECVDSRNILEEILGHEIRHFAYPFGYYNDDVKTIASESGYHTACIADLESLLDMSDRFKLPRLNIGMDKSLADIVMMLYTNHPYSAHKARYISSVVRKIPRPVKDFVKKILRFSKSN